MPQIPGYTDHIAGQSNGGYLDVHASEAAFGGQIGAGMQRFGGAIEEGTDTIMKALDMKQVSNVHARFAEARMHWTKDVADRTNKAVPGDDGFADRLSNDMKAWMDKAAGIATLPRARAVFADLRHNMVSEFYQRGISIQMDLAGKKAAIDQEVLGTSFGNTVYMDPTQWQAVTAQAEKAINDEGSIFSKVPAPMREKFLIDLKQRINYGAARGFVRDNPEATLASLDPAQVEMFKPFLSLLKGNIAKGGKLELSPETEAKLKELTPLAGANGVNPAVFASLVDQTKGKDAQETAQRMGALLNKYGGNYDKALVAFQMGPEALDNVLRNNGDAWKGALPKDAADFLSTVLTNGGQVSLGDSKVDELKKGPSDFQSNGSLPFLKGLSWEQTDHIASESVRLMHLKMSMAEKARAEQEHQLRKQQDDAFNGFINKILNPKEFGAYSDLDVSNNAVLTGPQKESVSNFYLSRMRQLRAEQDEKTHPEEFRRLFNQIHAASDDPTKTYNADNVIASFSAGRLSYQEYSRLQGEVSQLKDGGNSPFQKRVHMAFQAVDMAFQKDIMASIQPAEVANAWYRCKQDFDAKVEAKRKANEDPSVLLDPNHKEFFFTPQNLKSYMKTYQGTLREEAAKAVKYEVGKTYKTANGKTRTYLGGNPTDPKSWSE